MLRPELVHQHCRLRAGQHYRLAARAANVNVTVGRLRPLQRHIGPLARMIGYEAAYQAAALLLQHPYSNLTAGIEQLPDAPSCHLGKRVLTADNHPGDAFLHQHVGAGRRLAIMRTRLQTDINSGTLQQQRVGHRTDGIHLGMPFPATHVVAFAYDAPVAHDDRPHHRVGRRVAQTVPRQFYATAHVFLVFYPLPVFVHGLSVRSGCRIPRTVSRTLF